MEWVASNGKVDLIMCCMERKDTTMYSSIKRVAERKYGILTQCITMKSISRANAQLCGMVLMKMNAKLGGIACEVDFAILPENSAGLFHDVPVMVCGLEFNNPITFSGSSCKRPSIAALACSNDKHAASYNMVASISCDQTYARYVLSIHHSFRHF